MNFINRNAFDDPSAIIEASKGIIDPKPREIHAQSVMYRFGYDLGNAKFGPWWVDQTQYSRIESWAVLQKLAVPHAARVLLGVLHIWGEYNPTGVNMTVSIRASVATPLLAYEGAAKPQKSDKTTHDVPNEWIEAPTSSLDRPITQLFIPGLATAAQSGALSYGAPTHYKVGDSHIGGVPGFPAHINKDNWT